MLIDLAIVAFPFKLVWGLQMQKSMKFWVLAGFGIRLPYVHPAQNVRRSLTSFTDLLPPTHSHRYHAPQRPKHILDKRRVSVG